MNQRDQIIDHLKKNGSITPIEALRDYKCMRLAARINDLRSMGYTIETQKEKKNGKSYARYWLRTPQKFWNRLQK